MICQTVTPEGIHSKCAAGRQSDDDTAGAVVEHVDQRYCRDACFSQTGDHQRVGAAHQFEEQLFKE